MAFKMRTSKPSKGNKFYNTKQNGGYSICIVGKPKDKDCDVLANCVGYACGRFNEIIGEMAYPTLNCNAEKFIGRARELGLAISKEPTLGGIMVWQKGATLNGSDGAGHVAIVEKINSSTNITTSESGYNYKAFYTKTRKKGNGNWGQTELYHYLGCIVNPAVLAKTIDELAKEVLAGKWGNGSKRKKLLKEAGYDYSKVQARVNEILKGK